MVVQSLRSTLTRERTGGGGGGGRKEGGGGRRRSESERGRGRERGRGSRRHSDSERAATNGVTTEGKRKNGEEWRTKISSDTEQVGMDVGE